MFWSKARKIKRLEAEVETIGKGRDNLIAKHVQMQTKIDTDREVIAGLTADRDSAQAGITELGQKMDGAIRRAQSLVAERDQFAKRVEDLEEQIKLYVTPREPGEPRVEILEDHLPDSAH